ncbi:MAG: hypothetical protein KGL55_14670 [Rhodospirillales bacterium]|nr:hypothetical protein [Rhodospirillales bacterium]
MVVAPLVGALLATAAGGPAHAAPPPAMPGMMGHPMAGQGGPPMSSPDSRQEVHFPPAMQAQFLKNMRDHVETLNAILQFVQAGDYAGAAKVASARLGLDSPAAASCKPGNPAAGTPPMSKPMDPGAMSMDAMMALYMPNQMRAIGLAMHSSASEFAAVADKAAATHDTAAVIGALARITPNCVACHAAYRLR